MKTWKFRIASIFEDKVDAESEEEAKKIALFRLNQGNYGQKFIKNAFTSEIKQQSVKDWILTKLTLDKEDEMP